VVFSTLLLTAISLAAVLGTSLTGDIGAGLPRSRPGSAKFPRAFPGLDVKMAGVAPTHW
jgi:hypothetical protein